ncbi:ras-associated and pleckstrin homology domains-containing protein 1-like isoform X1 [Branchiostoma floridae x Branchiostoma belcheri]
MLKWRFKSMKGGLRKPRSSLRNRGMTVDQARAAGKVKKRVRWRLEPEVASDPDTLSGDEMDAEPDSDHEGDLDKMFSDWLGELDKMTKSLDVSTSMEAKPKSPPPPAPPKPKHMDNWRFSTINLETTGDTELDALLGDLCAIQQDLSDTMGTTQPTTPPKPPTKVVQQQQQQQQQQQVSSTITEVHQTVVTKEVKTAVANGSVTDRLEGVSVAEPGRIAPPQLPAAQSALLTQQRVEPSQVQQRTESEESDPDAKLDDLLSQLEVGVTQEGAGVTTRPPRPPQKVLSIRSEDSAFTEEEDSSLKKGPLSPLSGSVKHRLDSLKDELDTVEQLTELKLMDREASKIIQSIECRPPATLTESSHNANITKHPTFVAEQKAEKVKAEKIRIALEKIKEASVQKLVVKVFMDDGNSKTLLVDETMKCYHVIVQLVDKNHCDPGPDWTLVEQIPDLYMERVLEDHEPLVQVLLNWTRDTNNKLLFLERRDKYLFFREPQFFLIDETESEASLELAQQGKDQLLEEFLASGKGIPELEGIMYLKSDGKKSWKKYFFMLRASGLYYNPKGKAKSSRDLACLVQFDHVNVYYGLNFKKKYKAPTDFCFALKHPQIQAKSKYIKYFCCEEDRDMWHWVMGIRMAKYGDQLYQNFQEMQQDISRALPPSGTTATIQRSATNDSAMGSSISLQSTGSSSSSVSSSTLSSQGFSGEQKTGRRSVGDAFSEAWKKGETQHVIQAKSEPMSPTSPGGRSATLSISSTGSWGENQRLSLPPRDSGRKTSGDRQPRPHSTKDQAVTLMKELEQVRSVGPSHSVSVQRPPIPPPFHLQQQQQQQQDPQEVYEVMAPQVYEPMIKQSSPSAKPKAYVPQGGTATPMLHAAVPSTGRPPSTGVPSAGPLPSPAATVQPQRAIINTAIIQQRNSLRKSDGFQDLPPPPPPPKEAAPHPPIVQVSVQRTPSLPPQRSQPPLAPKHAGSLPMGIVPPQAQPPPVAAKPTSGMAKRETKLPPPPPPKRSQETKLTAEQQQQQQQPQAAGRATPALSLIADLRKTLEKQQQKIADAEQQQQQAVTPKTPDLPPPPPEFLEGLPSNKPSVKKKPPPPPKRSEQTYLSGNK